MIYYDIITNAINDGYTDLAINCLADTSHILNLHNSMGEHTFTDKLMKGISEKTVTKVDKK